MRLVRRTRSSAAGGSFFARSVSVAATTVSSSTQSGWRTRRVHRHAPFSRRTNVPGSSAVHSPSSGPTT
ncbi:Uncharacterised protein [Mycobacteroides abscessus]|nr:Uncharacterised protein [Mycobacteroides abscessus]